MTDLYGTYALNTKAHRERWASYATGSHLAGFGRRPHAACTHLYFFRPIAFDDRHRLEIRVETPAGMVFTKTYGISKRRAFSTFSSFSHIKEPPDLCT